MLLVMVLIATAPATVAIASPSGTSGEHFLGEGMVRGSFMCPETEVLVAVEQTAAGAFAAVQFGNEYCAVLLVGYAATASPPVYALDGSWGVGWEGRLVHGVESTWTGGRISIGPYGDGSGIPISFCYSCEFVAGWYAEGGLSDTGAA